MRALQAGDLLRIVERGCGESPTSAALAVLSCAGVGERGSDPARLPLGARDRLLLEVRARTVGGPLQVVDRCPACEAELELSLDAADLILEPCSRASADLVLQHGALSLRFRLPTSEDLLCVEACRDEREASRILAARCIESGTRGGRAVDRDDLEAELGEAEIEALGAAIAAADPQSDLDLELCCAECGHRFERELDVASFFLEELAAIARRLFLEIHTLARGYGWSESEILAMSAWRRRAYVEMLSS